MKTTIESYQNQAKINFIKLLIEKYENKFTYQNNLMTLSNQRLISLIIKNIQFLKAKLNQLENDILVTPTNETQLKNSRSQLNLIIKKRTRNTLLLNFCLLLHTVKKISTDKLVSIATKRKEKTDLLKRVHTLLVFEHNRLKIVINKSVRAYSNQ